ncbi:MAG TPA: hypothetical protein GX004_06125, partial [Firmicutes bacterium]|nr:hypothetical protein [Bacillota bacterium]
MNSRSSKAENKKKPGKLTVYFTPDEEKKMNRITDQLQLSKRKAIKEAFCRRIDNTYNNIENSGDRLSSLYNNRDLTQINKDNCRFKKVVELIVNRVSKILDAEMAGVMLYDEKSKELVL